MTSATDERFIYYYYPVTIMNKTLTSIVLALSGTLACNEHSNPSQSLYIPTPPVVPTSPTPSATPTYPIVNMLDFWTVDGRNYVLDVEGYPDSVLFSGDRLHFYEASSAQPYTIEEAEWFVVTGSNDRTYILELRNTDAVNNLIDFRDLSSGIRYNDMPSINLGGLQFRFEIDPQYPRIAVDQNGDGVIDGKQAKIVTQSGIISQEDLTQ